MGNCTYSTTDKEISKRLENLNKNLSQIQGNKQSTIESWLNNNIDLAKIDNDLFVLFDEKYKFLVLCIKIDLVNLRHLCHNTTINFENLISHSQCSDGISFRVVCERYLGIDPLTCDY